MSIGERLNNAARHPMTQLALTAGAALVHTAIVDHRTRTHQSVEPGPTADFLLGVAGAPFTDSDTWASVHSGSHHAAPDTNLHPFVEYGDLQRWLSDHPRERDRYPNPETITGMDPGLDEISHEDTVKIADLARQLVEGKYEPRAYYSEEEIEQILYNKEPRYRYETIAGGPKSQAPLSDKPSLDDVRFMLRDAHSPALHRWGIVGILLHNRGLYDEVDGFYRQNPNLRPSYLRQSRPSEEFIARNKGKIRIGLVAGSIAMRLLARKPRTAREGMTEAVKGAAISGAAAGMLIAGGNIVNALGHGGDAKISSWRFWKNLTTGRVDPKPNGTYTTDNQLLSPPTLGEVGGQFEHHEDPSLIAYTREKGVKRWLIDPFGCTVEAMVKREILLRPGKGFPESERRPDMPSAAVLAVEELRRLAYARANKSTTN